MKYFVFPSIFVIILFVFTGCKDYSKFYQEQLGQIDSLLVVIDDKEKTINEVDTSRIRAMIKNVEKNKAIYKNSNFTDTVSGLDFYAKLHQYESIGKSYAKLNKERGHFKEGLKYNQSRLEDLKYDIENNLLNDSVAQSKSLSKKELADFYINQEKQDVNTLLSKIENKINRLQGSMNIYDSLNLEIENFVEDIKASQNNE